jgi:hypothetical protein
MLILTGYTDNLTFGPMTEESWRRYAKKHGYEFECKRQADFLPLQVKEPSHAAWHKLHFLREALVKHEWTFWADADSLVTNSSIPIEALIVPEAYHHLTACEDCTDPDFSPWNSGHMLLHQSPDVLRLLDAASFFKQYRTERFYDQSALRLADAGEVRLLPYGTLGTCYRETKHNPKRVWRPGDFCVHTLGLKERGAEVLPLYVDEDAKWCSEHGEFDTNWTPPAAVPYRPPGH